MAASPAINIRSSHIDEQNSTRYLMEAMIGEKRLRQSFYVPDEARCQPGLIQGIMDRHEREFKAEVDMVAWASNTVTSTASSTASYHSDYYYANTTSATTTTGATATDGTDHWYALDAATTPIWTGRYHHGEYVHINGLHIKQVHLTHTQNMQLKINREWDRHCRKEKYAEQEKRRLIQVREREVAEDKAVTLLESFIGKKEVEIYKNTGKLYVKGKNGLYIAKKGGGIQKVEGNKVISYCVHLERKWKCPPTDEVVAMKFLLEEDDKNVIKIANRMSTHEYGDKLPIAACM